MIYFGSGCIDYLSSRLSESDPGESSHWNRYHSSYSFDGRGFSGLDGFGGYGPKWKSPLHRLMQMPYRKMAKKFKDFKAVDRSAMIVTKAQHRAYDLDVLRQVFTVSLLRKCLPQIPGPNSVACVIGDGFATATSLLLNSPVSAGLVVLVNLTKTLLVDLWYLRIWMGEVFESSVCLVTSRSELDALKDKSGSIPQHIRVVACQARDHELIGAIDIDYFINTASMQEMNPPVIAAYFSDMRRVAENRSVYFYCANREKKILPDGTIAEFLRYPWIESDEIIIDELCPWHQYCYTFLPPAYKNYDGPHRHRLVRISNHS